MNQTITCTITGTSSRQAAERVEVPSVVPRQSGSWKSKTLAKTESSLALKKLKENTSYQVRVRAYCKNGYDLANGNKTNWSKWSTIKTIKMKK